MKKTFRFGPLLAVCASIVTLIAGLEPRGLQAVETQAIAGCPANFSVDVLMNVGTRWEMCWERDAGKGLVLNQVSFTPRGGNRVLVLGTAALAQVMVSFDNATNKAFHLGGRGLDLDTLGAADCRDGVLRRDGSGRDVLCQQMRARGYAWRGTSQVQGQSLVLTALSHVDTDTYIQQWVFFDDGTIMPMLGVSGRLDPTKTANNTTGWPLGAGASRFVPNRFHTAYWRLNFDLAGSANDVVEQFDYSGSGNTRTQSVAAITTETGRTVSPQTQRFWRVKDSQLTNGNGHALSYQINLPLTAVHRGADAFTRNDLYVTNNRACEQFVYNNSPAGGCGTEIANFVNGETPGDVVVWVGTTWHQVARDEDEKYLPVHWQSVTLMPRDLMALSPLQ